MLSSKVNNQAKRSVSVCVLCVIRELLLKEKRKSTRIKEGGGMMGNMNLILTGVRTGGGDQALNNNKKISPLLLCSSFFPFLFFYSPFLLSISTLLLYSHFLLVLALPCWQVWREIIFFLFFFFFFDFFCGKRRGLLPRGLRGKEDGDHLLSSPQQVEEHRAYLKVRRGERGGLPCFPLGFAFCKTKKTTPRDPSL